jgi:signal transduction histidine kinase/phage shock protein PspC (stress-responsive transcriptional regulator)
MARTEPATAARPRLARHEDGKVIAGVAAGIADHLGVDRNLIRVAFVVLGVLSGFGVVAYVAGWLLLPVDDEPVPATAAASGRTWDWVQAGAIGAIVLGLLLLLEPLGLWLPREVAIPVALGAGGLALLVGRSRKGPGAGAADRSDPIAMILGGGTGGVVRVVVGVAFVVSGVGVFLATNDAFSAVRQGILATAVITGGLVMIFGPWLWRLARALTEERRDRIRSEERAEMAAHLHDSVLQTLAMIQRQADEPRVVTTLARQQERELRGWLFEQAPPSTGDDLGSALDGAAAEVERQYIVPIEVVRVGGNAPLDERLHALVLAAREAMVNAAVHSQSEQISVFVELEAERAMVFVRDRGVGFDRGEVAADRRGIAESIEGRMRRQGGKAVVRSDPGEGTEIELSMPRSAP